MKRYLFKKIAILAVTLSLIVSQAVAMNPATTEFAWDFHDTLAQMNSTEMAKIFLKHMVSRNSGYATISLISGLLFDYPRYYLTGAVGPRQELMNNIRALMKKGTVGEEYFDLIGNYDSSLRPIAEEMACAFKPTDGIPALLQELAALGYTQRLASNMGGGSERANHEKKLPVIFGYLQGGKAVDYTRPVLVKKPDILYFQEYQAEFNPNGDKTIIFIDDNPVSKSHPDRPKNTDVAQAAGMIGVEFKNVAQLRADLKKLGIPLS